MWRIDCSVTDLGKEQSKEAGITLARDVDSIDLVVVSPLRRALQTASYILESFPTTPRIEVSKDSAEIMVDPCDIGSPPSVLAKEFPSWDFSQLQDYWWQGGKSPEETLELMRQRQGLEVETDIEKRIAALREHLREQQQETIILVCHSETIWWLTSELKNGERFGTWTKNGEILDITEQIERQGDMKSDQKRGSEDP
jgi:broad specificity phosphatase PhoE